MKKGIGSIIRLFQASLLCRGVTRGRLVVQKKKKKNKKRKEETLIMFCDKVYILFSH